MQPELPGLTSFAFSCLAPLCVVHFMAGVAVVWGLGMSFDAYKLLSGSTIFRLLRLGHCKTSRQRGQKPKVGTLWRVANLLPPLLLLPLPLPALLRIPITATRYANQAN